MIEAKLLTIKMEVSLGTRGYVNKIARYQSLVVCQAWFLPVGRSKITSFLALELRE